MSKKIFLTFFLDSIQLSHGFSHVRCSKKSIPPDGITISRAVLSLLPVVEPAIDHLKNWQGETRQQQRAALKGQDIENMVYG